jgi:SAM-dependent methyltransferase
VSDRRPYLSIVAACEADLERYGDNYRGVGWTRSQEEVDRRYRVMLEVMRPGHVTPISLLDFGCGASHLYGYLLAHGPSGIDYSGLDLSQRFLELSRSKYPDIRYYEVDPLEEPGALPDFDYVVMNGVFNYRGDLSHDTMRSYLERLVSAVYAHARLGIAFNVMSTQVDWQRSDLFHLPMDTLASFLAGTLSRHFVIRHDYGLYEYTAYVYRAPCATER